MPPGKLDALVASDVYEEYRGADDDDAFAAQVSSVDALRQLIAALGPVAVFFHAHWSKPSAAAYQRLRGAARVLAPPGHFLAEEASATAGATAGSTADAGRPLPRLMWVDVASEEGSEVALAFKVRRAGALQGFVGGRRVLTLAANGAVNGGAVPSNSGGGGYGAVSGAAAALVALGAAASAAATSVSAVSEADVRAAFDAALRGPCIDHCLDRPHGGRLSLS
jgi:hypothetical protein